MFWEGTGFLHLFSSSFPDNSFRQVYSQEVALRSQTATCGKLFLPLSIALQSNILS
jgi:hypothetical protein